MIWTDRAESDLDEIWNYTRERWTEHQADLYIARINAAVSNDDVRRVRARAIDFVSPGVFRLREVRHFIYFTQNEDGVLVVRVLHDTMDETLHLP